MAEMEHKMTRKDYNRIADIIAQILWAEETLGAGIEKNKGAIDYILEEYDNYDSKKFWQAVYAEKLRLKGLFAE